MSWQLHMLDSTLAINKASILHTATPNKYAPILHPANQISITSPTLPTLVWIIHASTRNAHCYPMEYILDHDWHNVFSPMVSNKREEVLNSHIGCIPHWYSSISNFAIPFLQFVHNRLIKPWNHHFDEKTWFSVITQATLILNIIWAGYSGCKSLLCLGRKNFPISGVYRNLVYGLW